MLDPCTHELSEQEHRVLLHGTSFVRRSEGGAHILERGVDAHAIESCESSPLNGPVHMPGTWGTWSVNVQMCEWMKVPRIYSI